MSRIMTIQMMKTLMAQIPTVMTLIQTKETKMNIMMKMIIILERGELSG